MEKIDSMNQLIRFSRAVSASTLALIAASSGAASAGQPAAKMGATASRSLFTRAGQTAKCAGDRVQRRCFAHVLLISVDGMHGVDLQRFVAGHPASALGTLSQNGVTYSDAHTVVPTDSFPGLLALVTGGHPASTGVYYENSFDRTLFAPKSNCTGMRGTPVLFDESIDINANAIDGGGGVDPGRLTQQLLDGRCRQVYPHDFLRVNTLFEVVRARVGRTAWSDKEQSYEILNGPSGNGVDDLYNREIAAGGTTSSLALTEAYDDGKVAAILNEIDGKSSRGVSGVGVPALFGMNFQAVSVGQKLAVDPTTGLPGGYVDAAGTPTALLERALEHTDASLGKMLREIEKRGLAGSTLVVISAKHGQQPIDRKLRRAVDPASFATALASNIGNGFIQTDDLALVWLQDRSQKNERSAYEHLRSIAETAAFERGILFTPDHLPTGFGAWSDPRTPDFAVEPDPGVIYTTKTKIAEHGGFRDDDTHVALLVAFAGQKPRVVSQRVETTQVAPSILKAYGIDGRRLRSVMQEGTADLPELGF